MSHTTTTNRHRTPPRTATPATKPKAQEVVGAARRRPGRPDPRRPRHLRRQHRPAVHRQLPEPRQQPAPMGGHRVPDDVRRRPPPRRPDLRPPLPPQRVPHRPGPVHRRVRGQRARRQREPAHRRTRRPRTQRSTPHPVRDGAHHDVVRRHPAQDSTRHLGCRRQPRRRRRSPPRRHPHHRRELAGDLLGQRPRRSRRPPRRAPHHREGHRRTAPRPNLRDFDFPGALTVIAGLGALVYGISGTSTHGWTSPQTVTAFARPQSCSWCSSSSRTVPRSRCSRPTSGSSSPSCPVPPSCSASPPSWSAPCS